MTITTCCTACTHNCAQGRHAKFFKWWVKISAVKCDLQQEQRPRIATNTEGLKVTINVTKFVKISLLHADARNVQNDGHLLNASIALRANPNKFLGGP